MKEGDNGCYKQQHNIVCMSSNDVGHSATHFTRLVSVPNASCEGHDVWNIVLFKCPRIQVAPGPSGKHYDVITAMCLAI